MKRVQLFVFPLVAALVISAAVLAQDGNLVGRFAPFVVDVEQAVPVVVSVPVDVGDGDVMTATVPLTVSVALQVRVDGAGATVMVEDAPAPVVAVQSAESDSVDALSIPYTVLSGDPDIEIAEWEVYADNAGDWNVAGKLTNRNSTQQFGWIDVVVHFYREDGSVLSVDILQAGGGWTDPGNSARFKAGTFNSIDEIASYDILIEVETWQDSPNPIVSEASKELNAQDQQNREPLFNDVYWNVLESVDKGRTIELSAYDMYETLGRFVHVTVGLENRGTTARGIRYPLGSIDEYDDFYVVMVDDEGRQYAPFESGVAFTDECVRADVNPGLTSACWIVFEIATDAQDLSLRLVQRTDSIESTADITIDLQ